MSMTTMCSARAWLAAALVALAPVAWAKPAPYPDKPIRLIVGFPAGGASDVAARAIADKMAAGLGQSIIVENKPGAASNIGANFVAKSDPDGYTMLFGTISLAINRSLYKHPGYDSLHDLAAVSELASAPFLLVVNPASPIHSVAQLIAAAKKDSANHKPMQFASAGNGSGAHLFTELFTDLAGIQLQHVPYRGAAPAMADVLGGRVMLTFDNIITTLPLVKGGRLRALAVSSAQRSKVAPEIPTMQEAGVQGYDATSWFGLFVPKGTPPAVISKLSKAADQAVHDPAVSKVLMHVGAEPVGSSPEAFSSFFKSEVGKWAQVVHRAHVQIE
ncbi:tripartite tricarboxylate transporter substrate binding protein [Candidimonas humi]|uniref:Tripartite tricarboxylate transporter substrate binding protein n=1 Tax=Candidimonas humi TaxID=683355 RepID=A0ABV8NV41_9BURK|nr:tripartite tricarboxylate transporter substrate binding protein [Candidimonas humi]MBV6304776.1 tripartite tricarboxylate transporter substrate binding protein [Candidimonas humi]